MAAHIQKELPENLLLTRTSLHQGPFVRLATLGVVGASNKDL
jgi:hypothetical protein